MEVLFDWVSENWKSVQKSQSKFDNKNSWLIAIGGLIKFWIWEMLWSSPREFVTDKIVIPGRFCTINTGAEIAILKSLWLVLFQPGTLNVYNANIQYRPVPGPWFIPFYGPSVVILEI
jgi:hypothetical protein